MGQWLKYRQCFVTSQADPDPTLRDLLEGPLLAFDPYRYHSSEVKQFIHRWSLVYQFYQWAQGKRPSSCPPSLTANWPELPEKEMDKRKDLGREGELPDRDSFIITESLAMVWA